MHFKIFKMIATRGYLTAVECTKSVFGQGSAPDPAGGAHDAPPDPLIGWGGGHPSPFPTPLDAFGVSVSSPAATRPRRLRRLVPKTPSNFFSGYGLGPQRGHIVAAACPLLLLFVVSFVLYVLYCMHKSLNKLQIIILPSKII